MDHDFNDILKNSIYTSSQPRLSQNLNLSTVPAYETDISPLSNLRFADTTEFPQDVRDLIADNPDLLVDYHIYPEYDPYIAVDINILYTLDTMPPLVETIFRYILNQINIDSPYNQSQPFTLDI